MPEWIKRIFARNKVVGGIITVIGFLLSFNTIIDSLSSVWSKLKNVEPFLQDIYRWSPSAVGLCVMAIGFLWIGLGSWLGRANKFFRILKVSFDKAPADQTGVTYKNKVRLVMQSRYNKTLDLVVPSWIPVTGVDIQLPIGYKYGKRPGETMTLRVEREQVFDLWIGLPDSFTEDEFRQRHKEKKLGALVIPVKDGNRPNSTIIIL